MWWLFAHILILRPKSVISGSLEQRSKKWLFLAWKSISFKTTSQTNHMDLNTIEEENVWKYFLVPWDPLGASRVPNLAPNRGIFSKVDGTSPLGSGGHTQTIFSNGRFYGRQSSFRGDVFSFKRLIWNRSTWTSWLTTMAMVGNTICLVGPMTKRGESHNNAWHTGKEMLQKIKFSFVTPKNMDCPYVLYWPWL